ncbi:MAG: MarR family winged helix-turn-helix transcriptional regulator [Haloechinothrix sp.]
MAKDNDETDPVDTIVREWQRERPDLDPSPIGLFGRVHRVYLRYQAMLGRVFDEYNLNSASFDVLASLRRAGEPYRKSGSELAAGSLLSSAGVTLRLDRLEKAGLIERKRDVEDRRVVYSRLTQEGLRVIEKSIEAHLANEHRMLTRLTAEERAQLGRLLAKLEGSIIEAAATESG